MELKIPFYKQSTDFTCGAATLRMAMAFFGKKFTEDFLTKALRTSEKTGTDRKHMVRVAREQGFFCYVNPFSSLEEVRYFVSLGYPVIVNYNEPKDNEQHFAVVAGFDTRHLILRDPTNGSRFRLSIRTFLPRWRGWRGVAIHSRWMMAISPRDFSLGRAYEPF